MFTLCVLTFGNHVELAKRCLSSISDSDVSRFVDDIRVGVNCGSDSLLSYVDGWATQAAAFSTIRVLKSEQPLKYPTMRKMLHVVPPADRVMWFDDDSYITDVDFFKKVSDAVGDFDLIGQPWSKPHQGAYGKWLKTRKWYDSKLPPTLTSKFCTGGWWVVKSSVLKTYDWPDPELRHKGGDMLLGDLCRHAKLSMLRYDAGVRINADAAGVHSAAPRRGLSEGTAEREVGFDYSGLPLPTDHNNFRHSWLIYFRSRGVQTNQEVNIQI